MKPNPKSAFLSLILASSALAAPSAEQEFIEKLLQNAQDLAQFPLTQPSAIAVTDAALRLNLTEPRILRDAIDLQLQFGNRDKAVELLNQYRKLQPEDQLAQIQTIDLLVEGRQSADERRADLEKVAGVEALAPEVRSHICVQLYALLVQSGDDKDAAKWLNQAQLLNPVNPRVLQINLERLFASGGTAPQRTTAMVNLLKSNPMQPSTLALLAQELARSGATEQATQVYRKAFDMNAALGVRPDADDLIHYAALLLATEKPQEADSIATTATQLSPSSARAWFMRAMVHKHTGNEADLATVIRDAKSALIKNLMLLHRQVDKSAPQITEETTAAMPDIRADAKQIGSSGDLSRLYATTLGDLAWLDVYFTGKAADPVILEALITLTGENSLLTTRLQGFTALASGQFDEAQVKLSAIAQRDTLARVGLVAIRLKKGETKETLQPEASQLLSLMPVDVWSATVRHTLKDFAPISFTTDTRAQVIEEAAKLPDQWLKFPVTANSFYLMELTPLKVGLSVGEPLLMKLRVQNTSNFPLVIGPGGVIDQRVAIDAQVRGTAERYFPGAAVARLTADLVLQPRQSVITTLKIDSHELTGFLNSAPHIPLTIYASVVSNPRIAQQENGVAIFPGPGGFRQQAERVMERQPSPLAKDSIQQQLSAQLQLPDSAQRLVAYRTILNNVRAIKAVPQQTDQHRQLAEIGQNLLTNALAKESDPYVRALAAQMMLTLASPDQIQTEIAKMLQSADWQSRILGVLATIQFPQAKRADLLKPLKNDGEAAIKALAENIASIPDPSTQPAATPATNPSAQ